MIEMQQAKKLVKRYAPKWLLHLYWLSRVLRFRAIRFIPAYEEDELITAHNCDFMKDAHFMRCYNLAVDEGLAISTQIHWRAHVACWAAFRGAVLEGDFVECGVNKGFLSRIVMEYINFKVLPKTFYLMDTYEGLSEIYLTAGEREMGKTGGGYEPCYDQVKRTFNAFENVRIVKGVIPDALSQVTSGKVAYLSIDMNCVIPEIAAAEYFWDRLVPGAVMLLDDYGHKGHEEQKRAFDRFAKKRGVQVLSLPTGQGIVLRP